jgi:hypothetical protein
VIRPWAMLYSIVPWWAPSAVDRFARVRPEVDHKTIRARRKASGHASVRDKAVWLRGKAAGG